MTKQNIHPIMRLPKIPRRKSNIKPTKSGTKAGLPPGALIHVGAQKTEKKTLELIQYSPLTINEQYSDNAQDILGKVDKSKVNWINIDGLHNVELVKAVGEYFGLNPLILEDVLNTDQRPKLEEYEDEIIFMPMKALNTLKNDGIEYEQISFILGKHFILSFQEKEGDLFDKLRSRMHNPSVNLRHKKSDYLFYRLIDIVVDHYYLVMEHIGDHIESIEEEVYLHPTTKTMSRIQDVKREMIFLRKALYPTREALSRLIREKYKLIHPDTISYLNDVHDHIVQLIEIYEAYRDLVSNQMDMYMSTISNRMNEIMKVLTIISTIFIPLSFIAGVYGMNFQHMPELEWKYSYFAVLGVMFLIMIGMLLFFRRKKWL
jgi:magnesium transporter